MQSQKNVPWKKTSKRKQLLLILLSLILCGLWLPLNRAGLPA